MKIKDVQTTWLSLPLRPPLSDSSHVLDKIEWILVDVVTDEGLIGHSHMLTFDYGPELLKGIIDHELKKLVVGMDALHIAEVRQACWTRVEYIGQAGISAWGLAAIDIALWDILGKKLGCAVYKILGACRDSVPIYGSGGWLSYSTDELLGEMEGHVRAGFKAVKMKVGSPDSRRDLERIKAVREVIGNDVELMIDANQGWRVHDALGFCRKFEDYNIYWVEEPLGKDDLDGYARLAASTDIPIATGEREYSLGAFRELFQRNAVGVVQPDVLRIGGITQFVKLAHLAEIFNVRVASHFYKEIDIHLLASFPNSVFLEYFPWIDNLMVKPLQIENGMAKVPTDPGLSIEFKPEVIREFKVA